MKKELIKSNYGYFSIKKLPSQKELEEYYAQKYYQSESTQYSHTYENEELIYFHNIAQVAHYIHKTLYDGNDKTLLDVGSGEGFFSKYFYNLGWEITTLDYSDFGMKNHNAELLSTLIQGDIFSSIEKLILVQKHYSFINLSNVLEHVIDPVNLLKNLQKLLLKDGVLRISVPNDYSNFQKFLLEKNYTTETWFCPPEHLHYFTLESLSNFLIKLNYKIEMIIGEFPIELYILNESSNYTKNKSLGKYAHKARLEANNFLLSQGIEKYINYYKASAEIGLSRQIVVYATKNEDVNETSKL